MLGRAPEVSRRHSELDPECRGEVITRGKSQFICDVVYRQLCVSKKALCLLHSSLTQPFICCLSKYLSECSTQDLSGATQAICQLVGARREVEVFF